jgi:integrase
MKRAARHKRGSVVFDKRRRTWNFLWWEQGKRRSRRIGTLQQYRTKGAAWQAAQSLEPLPDTPAVQAGTTVTAIAARYESERLPSRFSTARMYRSWLHNHILPRWGETQVSDLKPREIELWLRSLSLSPKSKAHIRAMLRIIVDYAMWCGVMKVSRNPIELVVVKGATKRTRRPRSLTVEEFQKLVTKLAEPFRTMALMAVCFGLRVSELLALKWSDVDWLNGSLRIERAIVMQNVDEVKTVASRRQLTIAKELLKVLGRWRQVTQFSADSDWIFASPIKLGRLPISYPWYWRQLQEAAEEAGTGKLGTHSLRHTYRSWLDAVGTPVAVQQKLMRHTDIRTTMNVYGDVVTNEMAQASAKVAGLALNGSQSGLQDG